MTRTGSAAVTRRRQLLGYVSAGGAAATVLAACGVGGGETADIKPGGSGKQVTLRVGSRANGVAGDPATEETNAGKQLFESKYPKITIDLTWSMNPAKFLAAAAGDDAWDVQDLCCDGVPVEARAGVIMKLDPYIKKGLKESDVKDWIEWQYKYFNIDGGQYAIGKYMGCTALYFNKDWFQQKGVALPTDNWTWNDYRDAAVKLSDPVNKKFGFNMTTRVNGSGQPMGPDRRQTKVNQNGGNCVDPKNDLKSMLDSPKTIEAFEWIHDRIWKDHSSPQPIELPGYPDQILNQRLQFAQGHVAMLEDGSWQLVPLVNDKPGFDWDVVTLPKGPVQRAVLATTDAWAIWAGTKSVDDAWLLFSWFNSDDWYGIQSRRLQPARLSWLPKWKTLLVAATPELKGKNLNAFTVGSEQNFARPWELHRYHAAVNDLINEETDAAITRNEKPVKDGMIELARRINEIQAKEAAAAGK